MGPSDSDQTSSRHAPALAGTQPGVLTEEGLTSPVPETSPAKSSPIGSRRAVTEDDACPGAHEALTSTTSGEVRQATLRGRRIRRVLLACTAALLLFGAGLPALALATIYWFGRDAADIDISPLADYAPAQTVRVLARDGQVLGEIGGPEHRTVVALEQIPPHLVEAFLAAEDADFFRHGPADPRAILRATVANVTAGEMTQGASTITQQTVKNVLLTHERTLERKSKEILLAARVEHELGKRHVLGVYLNEIYLGEGRYGVQSASRHYFGRDVDAIDLGQAATLASLPKAPSAMSPYRDPDRLRARRDWVLRRMVAEGFAERDEVAAFLGQPLDVLPAGAARHVDLAPEVVDVVDERLRAALGDEALERFGGEVRTSLDPALQRIARERARAQLDALEARHGYGGHGRALDDAGRARVRKLASDEPRVGAATSAVVRSTADEAGLWVELGEVATLVDVPGWAQLDERARHARFPAGGRIEVQIVDTSGEPLRASLTPGPEVAVVLLDVEGGRVRALVGGRDHSRGGFDRARRARRQPGSAFKPFVYAAALESRRFTAASARSGEDGESFTLREALARSDNVVASQVLAELVSPDAPNRAPDYGAVQRLAGLAGIRSTLRPHPSLALGTSEVTPWELADAYATLARAGVHQRPRIIETIEPGLSLTPDGAVAPPLPATLVEDASPTRAIDPQVAFVLTQMMTSVIETGTGRHAQGLGTAIAGKTGTTDDAKDGWFVGYSPSYVAAVWVGFDQPRSLGAHEHGSSTALPIWRDVMAAALDRRGDAKARAFDPPSAINTARIDARTGTSACRLADRWWTEGHCSGGWFFRHCEPAGPRAHTPYRRCADPGAWREEWFVEQTRPEPYRRTHASTVGVFVLEVAVFDDAEDDLDGATAQSIARWVELRRVAVEHALADDLPRLARVNASVGGPERVPLRVRFDAAGAVRSVQVLDPATPSFVASSLGAAVHASGRFGSSPPSILLDRHGGEAELRLEVVLNPATLASAGG